ncbi:MAG: cobalt ECF transporter T component CbiQ [Candidatus Firestonebacteria bacterium]|nr:cobalt ECF transporter T component CbiQ [Candidatus Firestonebacteria bacterium]
MAFNQFEFFDLGYLDYLSYKNTFIHRIDPRAKLIVSLIFIIIIISFPKYEVSSLFPFFFFPIFLIVLADLPLKIILKKIVIVSPFALMVGIFNPIFDRKIFFTIFNIGITGGFISYFSIIIKFVLTISAALILIATTSFPGICVALEKLKVPKIFVLQLMFLYRYIFVLGEEVARTSRARELRSFGKNGYQLSTTSNILGNLLLKTIDRSERIYQSMCSRGFVGYINIIKKTNFTLIDFFYMIILSSIFILLRIFPVSYIIGNILRSN